MRMIGEIPGDLPRELELPDAFEWRADMDGLKLDAWWEFEADVAGDDDNLVVAFGQMADQPGGGGFRAAAPQIEVFDGDDNFQFGEDGTKYDSIQRAFGIWDVAWRQTERPLCHGCITPKKRDLA